MAHQHDWGPWGDWFYAGQGLDGRDRSCLNPGCTALGGLNRDLRAHRHDRGTVTKVKGVRVRKCNGCGGTL